MTFRALHRPGAPFLLANVWDVNSALAAVAAGYSALGTSSAAVAKSLGYEDGEQLPFEYLLLIVKRIRAATQLPLSVDIESGYACAPGAIVDNLEALARLGVAGVNIEDSRMEDGERILLERDAFVPTLTAVITKFRPTHPEFFFNVRTDTFLLQHPDALAETSRRAEHYARAGADGLFVPGLVDPAAIATVTAVTELPLNVMCWPGLPSRSHLAELGVARISSGNFAYEKLLGHQRELFATLVTSPDFSTLL